MTQHESLDTLNEKIAELDRQQNAWGDMRNMEEIKKLLPIIRAAEKRENRRAPYLRWLYIDEE
jgi:hypothetical protein